MFAGHISLFKFAKTSSASAASSLQQVVLLPLYFGCRWAAYWCSRLGGLRVRLLHQFVRTKGYYCSVSRARPVGPVLLWFRKRRCNPLPSVPRPLATVLVCLSFGITMSSGAWLVASYYTGSSDSTQTRDLLAGLFDEVFLASDDFAVMDDCRALQDGASPADGAPGRSTLDFVPVVSTPCRDQHHSWDR